MDNQTTCSICSKKLQSHSCRMSCSACNKSFHISCLSISKTDSMYKNQSSNIWLCILCLRNSLPFIQLDDGDFYECTITNYYKNIGVSLKDLNDSSKTFHTFDQPDDSDFNPLNEIDPDENFYRYLPSYFSECAYYDDLTLQTECIRRDLSHTNFSLIHFNARSACKNLSNIESYLHCLDFEFSIVGLTETWYNENNVGLYRLSGYNQEDNYRKGRGGGVSLHVKKCIEYKPRPDLDVFNDDIESVFVEINGKSINSCKNHIVGVIYRPPNRDIESFWFHLRQILDRLKSCRQYCHLLGDYNINLLKADDHISTSNFIDDMYSYSFIPMITKPSRITDRCSTLIDNIFTNAIQETKIFNGLLYTDISDHLPVFVIFKDISKEKDNGKDDFISKRSFHPDKIANFRKALQTTNWDEKINTIMDPQQSFSAFHNHFNRLYNKYFPMKEMKIGYKTRKPWLTSAMKKSIHTKNLLYVKSLKFPSDHNTFTYKQYKNKLNYLLRKLERDHIQNLLTLHKNNMKKTWKILKDIINKNRSVTPPQEYFDINGNKVFDRKLIANSFNSYYTSIGPDLCKALPKCDIDPSSYLKDRNLNSMFIMPTDEYEIKKIIGNLKISAAGWDELSAKIIKECRNDILYPLAHVFNRSLTQGVFPSELKIAKVIPLYKGDSKCLLSNYRPVSILPVMSKILERLMYNRLLSFINEHKILYKLQFGFRDNHSTSMALMTLVDHVANSIDNGDFTLGVFLDFSKAFDCLNHDILFKKLNFYGIRGRALDWFRSYLTERHQFVLFDNTESEYQKISCGVPQGSILGPLLFLIYVNDIVNVSDVLLFVLYADDTNGFISGRDIDSLIDKMNQELDKLVTWLYVNKLKLNVKKTHFMIFTSGKKQVHYSKKLFICNKEINAVTSTKFLGVHIDYNLKWNVHVTHIKKKIAKGLGAINKAKRYLNYDALRTLYHSFIHPYFDYCLEIWGSANKTIMAPLFRMQKKGY